MAPFYGWVQLPQEPLRGGSLLFTSLLFTFLKQTKSKNNSLTDHLFLNKLWHIISIFQTSLGIIYGFRLDASEDRL